MIEKIQNQAAAHAHSAGAKASATGGADFATLHKKALAKASASNPQQGADGQPTEGATPGLNTKLKPPKGETWGPVEGHPEYADILSGPRNGFYVNLAPGKRQGQTFVIVHRDGKTFHVYGEGKNRKSVEVRETPKPLAGEQWQQVGAHRDYKKIDGGKRDGEYVNLSGNERQGRTFEIVERDGKRYHAYGTGKDRLLVHVGWHRESGS
ncbi:MAG TPA: hypothetical protein VF752_13060 [Thermoleophilaceae bacterium]